MLFFPHLVKSPLPLWQNHAFSSLQNITQGSNSLWNHPMPIPSVTRHTNYMRNLLIFMLCLVFLLFLRTQHFMHTHWDSHRLVYTHLHRLRDTCSRLYFLCWLTSSTSLEISLRAYWAPKKKKSGGSVTVITVTNIATVIKENFSLVKFCNNFTTTSLKVLKGRKKNP